MLGRLADPGPLGDFSGCPVATAYLRLLRTERHRDVRRAVVACAPLCSRTLPALVERSRDSDDGVRRAVFVVLAEKVPMAALSIGARCALLDRGLRDRAPSVAGAARAMLVRWLDVPAAQGGCDGDVGALLGALDVDGVSASSSAGAGSAAAADSNDNEASSLPSPSSPSPLSREAVAEAALRALDAEGRLHAAPLARAASETGSGLRRKLGAQAASPAADDAAALASAESGDGGPERGGPGEAAAPAPPMSPEEALLWRVVAAVLSERATARGRAAANSSGAVAAAHAAAASEALSALEAALPDTVEQLCDLVRDAVAAANDAAVVSEAEAARAHRFVARQLVKVVATVADLADEAGRAAAAGLLGFLLADAASATAQLSGGAADDEEEDEADGAASDGEDGAGGDRDAAAREWTDALAALARAATATPCEVCPAALASIALRLPGQLGGCCGGSGAAGDGMDEEDAAAALAPTGDAAAWRGCLGAAAALLRCLLPNSRVGAREVHGPLGSSLETLADLRPALVAPALCHSSPRVRAAAVEAAGLLSLASDDGGEVAALVAALRAAATADEPRVAARAVRALSDATLVRGPRALDALVAEVDEEEEEDAGEEGEGVAGGGEEAPELPATSSAAAAASEASPPGRRKRTKAPEQQQPRRQQPQPILALLSDAVSSLGSEDPCAVAGSEAAAEGLAKILLHRGADDAGREVSDGAAVAALSKLLAVVGEGDALAAPRARQALAVFFPMYAARGSRAAARLGAAALPAARAAAAADGKASSGADVLRYVAGVLGSVTAAQQAQRLRQQQQQQQQGRRFGTAAARANANSYNLPRYCPAAALLTARAAVALFREARRVAPVAVAKPYAAAAVTLACALPMLLPASASALVVSPSPLMPHGQPAAPPPVPAARRVAAAAEAAAGSLPASSGAAKVAQALARRLLSSAAALVAGENNNNNAAEKEEDDVAARLAATALGSAAAAPAEAEGAGEASASGNGAAPRAAATSGSALADADGDDEEEEDAFWSSLCEEAGVPAVGAALPFEAELAALGGGVGVGRRSTAAAAVAADEDAAGGATPLRRTRRAAAARATGRLRKVVADDVTSGSSSSESEEEENSSSSSDDEGGGDGNESGGDNVGEGGDVDTRRSRSAATASKIEDSSSEDDEDVGDDENTAPLMTANSSLSPAPSSFSRPLSPSAAARSASKGFADCDEGNREESFGGLSGGLVRFSPAI